MADYDYKLAKKTIQKYSVVLESAQLGMAEDWYWTAKTVYENQVFVINLDVEPKIAGIKGSSWATPTLLLSFKDGTERWLDCYTGMTDIESKPVWFELGVLSSPRQDAVDEARGKFLQ